MIDALSAAAEPTRRRILQLLASRPRTVSNIAAEFTVTRSAISQHLSLLAEVGLVVAEKVGRERIYRVVPEGLRRLQAEIDRFWTVELDRLIADAGARRTDAHARETGAYARETDAHARESDAHARRTDAHARETGAHARETGAHELTTRASEGEH